jgi:hypothetical protein
MPFFNRLLSQEVWKDRSTEWIASACHVHHSFVRKIREQVEAANGKSSEPRKTTGRDGKSYSTTKSEIIVCEECQRRGSARPGCPFCKDERRIAAKARRQFRARGTDNSDVKEPDTPQPKDAFGNVLPKHARDAYCDPWLQQSYDFLTGMQERFLKENVAKGMAKREKRYPFFRAKDVMNGCRFIQQYLDQLIDHFKTQRPAGVCPKCDGNKCGSCRMSGVVPRELYRKLKETDQ